MVCDGDGNRLAKTANGVTTHYLVDDLNPTGYAQVVEETINGAPNREYTYGLQRIDEDQIVNNAWTPSFYGYDGFGTVRQLTSLTGAVTDTYEYDAFGNQITHTGSTSNNYLYRGEQFDPDLGLYYLRARYYNPATGRFMSRDPEDGTLRMPITLHKYLYADGDPVDGFDPTGRGLFEYGSLSRKIVAVVAGVALLSNEIAEAIDCVSEAVGSLVNEHPGRTVSASSEGCYIKFHDEWPTEPPEGPPGPPRWRQPWERGGPGDPVEAY